MTTAEISEPGSLAPDPRSRGFGLSLDPVNATDGSTTLAFLWITTQVVLDLRLISHCG